MPGSGNETILRSVVAVGASGGSGLLDMANLLALLPANFPGCVLLDLHRPVDQASNLAQILQRASALPVVVAGHWQRLQPGTCYVGEPAAHLALCSPTTIGLVTDARHAYRNGTIDLLFGSVADHAAHRGIGVVLSGCLADGSGGVAAIMAAGGVAMARDPWPDFEGDMPRNAIAIAGPLHCVDRLSGLAQAIVVHVMGTGVTGTGPASPSQATQQRMASLHRLRRLARPPGTSWGSGKVSKVPAEAAEMRE